MFNSKELEYFINELSDYLSEEDVNEIKKIPEDINDIQKIELSDDNLNKLKDLIESASRENVMDLLSDLSKCQDINPNKNVFSSSSKKEILQYKLKKKINELQKKKMELYENENENENGNENKNENEKDKNLTREGLISN